MNQDTQWKTYEVFSQRKRGDAHEHVGSVHAPDAEMALMLARDQFSRRERVVQLWVVPSEYILSTSYEEMEMMFDPMKKDYREAGNYRVRDMIRDWEATQSEEKNE